MAEIDTSLPPLAAPRTAFEHVRQLVLFSLAFSVMLAATALVVTGASDGWRIASEMVSRFSVVLFVTALLVEPLARLFPSERLRRFAKLHDGIMLAFLAVFAMSLVLVLAPSALGATQLSIAAFFYSGLNGVILVVMLLSFSPARAGYLSAPAWRAMRRIATAYYWLAFTMWNFGQLNAPGRPDGWYAFSLFLLLSVILARLADWFVARQRARQLAEKVA
jgi:hypothetical protein